MNYLQERNLTIDGMFMETKFNDFNLDLKYSLDNRDAAGLDNFYFRVFPHLERIELVEDLEQQKKGIDKILHFKNGKSILIDEKKRRKDYGDILLEEYSNFDNKKVGWLGREKYTDYIVYVIMESMTIYLLPFLLLQLAWIHNYKNWLNKYGRKFADNNSYRTSNIAIPPDVLLEVIKAELTLM